MAEDTQKPGRATRILLFCSLALNLAILGLVIGTLTSGRMQDGPPRSIDLSLGPIARALEPEDQREVRRSLRQSIRLRDIDMRGRFSAVQEALTAEPFDPEAFGALVRSQQLDLQRLQQKAQDALIAHIAQMTPEQRAAFAERLLQEMEKSRQRAPRPNSGG